MKIKDKIAKLSEANRLKRTAKKRLRGPTDLNFAIADRIGLLNESAWDSITAPSGFFLSRAYLAMLETVSPSNLTLRYALVSTDEGATPIAAIVMQVAEISPKEVRPLKAASASKREKLLAPLKQKINALATQRVLVCGNLLTYGQHGVAVAKGFEPEAIWHAVAEALYRVREAEKLTGDTHFVLIKDLHAPFTDAAKQLEALSYRYVETEPNMVLTLDPTWKSHDDYLASMASKYRSSVKNAVLKPMEEAGCTIEILDDVRAHEARLHTLYLSVQANADVRPFTLHAGYFSALKAAAGKNCRISIARKGASILGFVLTLADGETAIVYHIGFDREAAAGLPIYLRLLHAGIAESIAMGCKTISFGRTALEPKATLGAKPQTFGVLMRHRQGVLNKLIKNLLIGFEHDDAPERSPFKTGKKESVA